MKIAIRKSWTTTNSVESNKATETAKFKTKDGCTEQHRKRLACNTPSPKPEQLGTNRDPCRGTVPHGETRAAEARKAHHRHGCLQPLPLHSARLRQR